MTMVLIMTLPEAQLKYVWFVRSTHRSSLNARITSVALDAGSVSTAFTRVALRTGLARQPRQAPPSVDPGWPWPAPQSIGAIAAWYPLRSYRSFEAGLTLDDKHSITFVHSNLSDWVLEQLMKAMIQWMFSLLKLKSLVKIKLLFVNLTDSFLLCSSWIKRLLPTIWKRNSSCAIYRTNHDIEASVKDNWKLPRYSVCIKIMSILTKSSDIFILCIYGHTKLCCDSYWHCMIEYLILKPLPLTGIPSVPLKPGTPDSPYDAKKGIKVRVRRFSLFPDKGTLYHNHIQLSSLYSKLYC